MGKKALLKYAFRGEVQKKCDASMNVTRRRRSPKARVNFISMKRKCFAGRWEQVPWERVWVAVAPPRSGPVALSSVPSPRGRIGARAEGLAGGWLCSNRELPLLSPAPGAFLGHLCCRQHVGFAF